MLTIYQAFALYTAIHCILKRTPRSECYKYPHFTDEEAQISSKPHYQSKCTNRASTLMAKLSCVTRTVSIQGRLIPILPALGPLSPDLKPSKGIQNPDHITVPLELAQTFYGRHQTAGPFPLASLLTAICTPL